MAKGGKELKFLLPNLPELPRSSEVQSSRGGEKQEGVDLGNTSLWTHGVENSLRLNRVSLDVCFPVCLYICLCFKFCLSFLL